MRIKKVYLPPDKSPLSTSRGYPPRAQCVAGAGRRAYNFGMVDSHRFLLFFMAALVLAITPGPGIFYVLARSLGGGRREGIESSLGTFVGGLFHVLAAALGISAILAASA